MPSCYPTAHLSYTHAPTLQANTHMHLPPGETSHRPSSHAVPYLQHPASIYRDGDSGTALSECCLHLRHKIADTQDDSKQSLMDDNFDAQVYTDCSGLDGRAGMAAVLYRGEQIVSSMCYHLGPLEEHTTFEVEGVGVLMGLELLQRERGIRSSSTQLDNQGVIQAAMHIRSRPGQHILSQIYNTANCISDPNRH